MHSFTRISIIRPYDKNVNNNYNLKKYYLWKYACQPGIHFSVYDLRKNTLAKNYQKIPATKNTPEVILDPKGIIRFTGRLIPENADEFFCPLEEWINEYFLNPADTTTLEIFLEYINSAGTKYLLSMIDNIHGSNKNGKVVINWYYEEADQDMLDKGTILSLNLNVPFNFIASN